jgi:hypothetical protein
MEPLAYGSDSGYSSVLYQDDQKQADVGLPIFDGESHAIEMLPAHLNLNLNDEDDHQQADLGPAVIVDGEPGAIEILAAHLNLNLNDALSSRRVIMNAWQPLNESLFWPPPPPPGPEEA